jgi:hypothetical protein
VGYEKKKAGDPDYDPKVPPEQHFGKTAKDADGNDVLVTETNGPVKEDGSHAVMPDQDVEDGDNRPAPGGVATEASTVQVVDDDPRQPADKGKRR